MLPTPLKSWISQIRQSHSEFGDELAHKSFQHIFYLGIIGTPVSAIHVLVFLMLDFDTDIEQRWLNLVIWFHSTMFLMFALFGFLARPQAQDSLSARTKRQICLASHIAVLLAGVTFTSIDQLVTPAVTAFLIACTVAGSLFLVNPLRALLIYCLLFPIYFFALSLTQHNNSILVSNLFSGLTACSIAIGLSWIFWRQNIQALGQQKLIQQQQRDLELNNQQLERLATRDDLTGLANRRMLQMLADEEQVLMKLHHRPASLLLLDLDRFKTINDDYGHPAGDQILCQLAALLTQSLRRSDQAARWGGEEFGILLRYVSIEQAHQVAENIRRLIQKHAFFLSAQNGEKVDIQMTASIGLASMNADESDMLAEAYRRADVALYEAKSSGRNRVVRADH